MNVIGRRIGIARRSVRKIDGKLDDREVDVDLDVDADLVGVVELVRGRSVKYSLK